MDIGSDMAVSINWGPLQRSHRAPLRSLGLLQGRFRVDPHRNYMAVNIHCGILFVGVLVIRALLQFGVCIGAADFGKLPFRFGECSQVLSGVMMMAHMSHDQNFLAGGVI